IAIETRQSARVRFRWRQVELNTGPDGIYRWYSLNARCSSRHSLTSFASSPCPSPPVVVAAIASSRASGGSHELAPPPMTIRRPSERKTVFLFLYSSRFLFLKTFLF
ncbi:hypothetical protein TorRG33x02_177550, partial [Trema orientale]